MTRRARPLYGLDIETDTTHNGLDPRVAAIVAIAVVGPDGDAVFTGPEPGLLAGVDEHLRRLEPGTVVTWNGAAFDLPFVAERAEAAGVDLGLTIIWDAATAPPHDPLPGHPGRYRAVWHRHQHLDAYRAYRALTDPDVRCSLKVIARLAGHDPVELDAGRLHEVGAADLRRYIVSDATLTRQLAQQRWTEVASFCDALRPGCRPALFTL